MGSHSKRLKAAYENIDRKAVYELVEAVKKIKAGASAKFDETVEIAMNLGVDPRHADQNVRGVVALPHGTGKSVRVAVFAKGPKAEFRVEKAGIVHAGVGKTSFGEDALVENIRAFIDAISRAKPSGAKGTYIKRISLSSTMGPGVRIEVGSVHA